MKLLPHTFYLDDNPLSLAEQLLGAVIHTNIDHVTSGRIVELEVYKAPEDKGSHAYQNNKTPRTSTMFAEGGIAYIYLCYGIHEMFNIVTGPENMAHAILIRAIEPITGTEHMLKRRSMSKVEPRLCNGPGKLTAALGITREFNGSSLFKNTGTIGIYADPAFDPDIEIVKGARVGIAYAEECAHWPWRFYIKGNKWVSKPLHVTYKPKISS